MKSGSNNDRNENSLKPAGIVISIFLVILFTGFILIDTKEASANLTTPIEISKVLNTVNKEVQVDEKKIYGANECVNISDDVSYRVLEINADYETFVQPKENYRFIEIKIEFVNLSSSSVYVNNFICKNDNNENCEEHYLSSNIISTLAPESKLVTSFFFEAHNESNGLILYYNNYGRALKSVELDLPKF